MRIKTYSYCDDPDSVSGWKMSKVEFGSLNLIVGISGSGKTRLLNTISHLGSVARNKIKTTGSWKVSIELNDSLYNWEIVIKPSKDELISFNYERLTIITNEKETELIKRTDDILSFEGAQLPKLSRDESVISLLKKEDSIKPLYDGFVFFVRRELTIGNLKEAAQKHLINFNQKKSIKEDNDLRSLISLEGINDRLEILNISFPDIFDKICEYFINTFPFIQRIDIKNLESPFGRVPIFCIKEKNVDAWIPIEELSSGMQKVLFMLTDICSLPDGSVYFIDEYENSLGVNAINSLPELFDEYKNKIQFFITSHHPYLINNIPVDNWYLCYRKGQEVKIKYGNELVERYGTSKQKAFINLMNDTIYSEGVE